jgi:uncharacterized protein
MLFGRVRFCKKNPTLELIYPLQMEASHWISAKPAEADAFEAGAIQLYRNVLREGVIL